MEPWQIFASFAELGAGWLAGEWAVRLLYVRRMYAKALPVVRATPVERATPSEMPETDTLAGRMVTGIDGRTYRLSDVVNPHGPLIDPDPVRALRQMRMVDRPIAQWGGIADERAVQRPTFVRQQIRDGGIICGTCHSKEHLAYQCDQRGHATVVTIDGRVREVQWIDRGHGPVEESQYTISRAQMADGLEKLRAAGLIHDVDALHHAMMMATDMFGRPTYPGA